MKINPAKLTLEDFPGQRDWIGPLFTILNTFTGDTVRGTTNQISVEDNLFQEIKEIRFKNIAGEFPLKFRTKFAPTPKGQYVIYLYDHTDETYSMQAPWVVISFANGQGVISSIENLIAGHDYTMRLKIIYG